MLFYPAWSKHITDSVHLCVMLLFSLRYAWKTSLKMGTNTGSSWCIRINRKGTRKATCQQLLRTDVQLDLYALHIAADKTTVVFNKSQADAVLWFVLYHYFLTEEKYYLNCVLFLESEKTYHAGCPENAQVNLAEVKSRSGGCGWFRFPVDVKFTPSRYRSTAADEVTSLQTSG